jgi:hypothetical protein
VVLGGARERRADGSSSMVRRWNNEKNFMNRGQ